MTGKPHHHGARVTRFHESWRNATRITTVRIVSQALMFALFTAFVLLTTFANLDRMPALRRWLGKFLEIDPLISISTALTTHTIYKGLLWGLVILIPTLFIGRFFCNWICPYGTLHHFTGWVFRKRTNRQNIEANGYRRRQHVKYYILAGMLLLAVFGMLQIGLLDPICLLHRSMTGAVMPALSTAAPELFGDYRLHRGAWIIGIILFVLVAMNFIAPRFFCRTLCPLGALLGVTSRYSWWRIERDPEKCTGCNLCLLNCEGACDPHAQLRKSECFVCFNCIEDCPEGALSFAAMPRKSHEVTGTDTSRRKLVFAAVTGAVLYPFLRTSGRTTRDFASGAIRPPGSVEELAFLERCIKCDQCVRVCPTNVLQPAGLETGLEGLWTPVLNFRMGHCQLNCTACGHVCPTGAIQPLPLERKLGLGEFAGQGPIRLGMAHFDVGRCLPHSKNVPCVVCEEVCPTSPKAIYTERRRRTVRDGEARVLRATPGTVTVEMAGHSADIPWSSDQWKGDDTARYHVLLRHHDGTLETHPILGNTADTLAIPGRFARHPERGERVEIQIELEVPHIDTRYCIGCGLCERECPVVGDRRAVYVTAEGETRSQHVSERDRNRSVRLMKNVQNRLRNGESR